MTDNAFERQEESNQAPRNVDEPLFTEDDLPMFEQIQRALPDDGVDDAVEGALKELPPTDAQVQGIKQNIQNLKDQGLWATARFYEKLLEKREAQEG